MNAEYETDPVAWENRMIDEQAAYDQEMARQQAALAPSFENEHVITEMHSALKEAREHIEALECLIKKAKEAAFDAPELNMGNYTDTDVSNLNNGMIEVYSILDGGI